MRNYVIILVMLFLLAACNQPASPPLPTAVPTAVPPQPTAIPPTATQEPTPTEMPTLPPPTATPEPTPLPPTPDAPTPRPVKGGQKNPQGSAEFGSIMFEDDFSTDKGVWPQDGDENDGISVTNTMNDMLVTHVIQDMYDISIPLDYDIQIPVLVNVDARILEGDSSGSYGVACGYQDVDNYVGMTMSENGYLEFFQWKGGVRETIWEETNSAVVKTGWNALKAICDPDMAALFVNGEIVYSFFTDSPLEGRVGLLAGTLDIGDIYIGFDNFVLTSADDTNMPAALTLPTAADPTEEAPVVPPGYEGAIYYDDFSSDQGYWDIHADDVHTIELVDDIMAVTIHETDYDVVLPNSLEVSGPVIVDVNGTNLFGHKNTGYGVICGYSEDYSYYAMTVTGLKHASIFRWSKGVRYPLWDLYDVGAIQAEGNHLTGVCNGRDLEFWVNGKLLKSIRVATPIEGGVGLVVSSFGSDEVTLGFDNFAVKPVE